MIAFINEYGILLFLAVTAISVIGISGLFYVMLVVVAFVLREYLRFRGALKDFVRWRSSRPIHEGKPKKEAINCEE